MCNVDISTGRLSLSAVDFDLPGRVPLTFKRHYRSTNLWLGDLGYGWAHPFGVALSQAEDGGMCFADRMAGASLLPSPLPRNLRYNPPNKSHCTTSPPTNSPGQPCAPN